VPQLNGHVNFGASIIRLEVPTHIRPAVDVKNFAFALCKPNIQVAGGSRKFPLETMPDFERSTAHDICAAFKSKATPDEVSEYNFKMASDEINEYNAAAVLHEATVAKYCAVLGTTLAGIVNLEDRVAVSYLAGRKEVQPQSLGCIGLSGGGMRSTLLQATDARIRAAVVVGLMPTYAEMLDHNISCHTWMMFPSGWSRHGDWADLAACRAPSPLLVQYDEEDGLFTPAGMRAAHRRIKEHYRSVGAAQNYVGQFYPGPHKFDLEMQTAAFEWLTNRFATRRV
jgi:hypothetical protein